MDDFVLKNNRNEVKIKVFYYGFMKFFVQYEEYESERGKYIFDILDDDLVKREN